MVLPYYKSQSFQLCPVSVPTITCAVTQDRTKLGTTSVSTSLAFLPLLLLAFESQYLTFPVHATEESRKKGQHVNIQWTVYPTLADPSPMPQLYRLRDFVLEVVHSLCASASLFNLQLKQMEGNKEEEGKAKREKEREEGRGQR